MGKPETFVDEYYCPNCGQDTKQKVETYGHERDSSNDTKTCLKCGWEYSWYSGEWYSPSGHDGQTIKD